MTVKGNTPMYGTAASPTLIDDARKAIGQEDMSPAELLRVGLYRLLGIPVNEAIEQAKMPMGRPKGSSSE